MFQLMAILLYFYTLCDNVSAFYVWFWPVFDLFRSFLFVFIIPLVPLLSGFQIKMWKWKREMGYPDQFHSFSSLSMAPPRQRGLPDARQRGNYGLHTIIGAHIQFPCLQILLWPSSVLSNRVGSCLNPNSILHIIIFTHRCEAYLGTPFLPFVQISLLLAPAARQLPAHGDWRSWGTTLVSPSIYRLSSKDVLQVWHMPHMPKFPC
jgi:hypothetical protein